MRWLEEGLASPNEILNGDSGLHTTPIGGRPPGRGAVSRENILVSLGKLGTYQRDLDGERNWTVVHLVITVGDQPYSEAKENRKWVDDVNPSSLVVLSDIDRNEGVQNKGYQRIHGEGLGHGNVKFAFKITRPFERVVHVTINDLTAA